MLFRSLLGLSRAVPRADPHRHSAADVCVAGTAAADRRAVSETAAEGLTVDAPAATPVDGGSIARRALAAIDGLQARLDALERARTEPIAVVGIGCRFPGGASSPDAFWRVLRDGIDAISEVPRSRWDIDAHYDPDPATPGRMYKIGRAHV